MIRSGARAAIFSIWMPLVSSSTSGSAASPSASVAHGKMYPGASPNHLVTATGTMPSASRASWSVSPTETTRVGAAVTSVSPYLCLIVAGKADSSAGLLPASVAVVPGAASSPQALNRPATAITDSPERKVRRVGLMGGSPGWVVVVRTGTLAGRCPSRRLRGAA